MRRRGIGLLVGAAMLAGSAVPAFAAGRGPVTGAQKASITALTTVCAAVTAASVKNPNDLNQNQEAVLGALLGSGRIDPTTCTAN